MVYKMVNTIKQLSFDDLLTATASPPLVEVPESQSEQQSACKAEQTRTPIYTIGYGNRSVEKFMAVLKEYQIQYVIDIRSKPFSRANQQFSKGPFERLLIQNGLHYVFMGDTLGGRPADATCYVEGRVDYSKVRTKEFYQQGISRLQTAWNKQIPVALLCAEAKPQECHRSKLIGNTLTTHNINVVHIDENGRLKSQEEIVSLLLGNQPLLFNGSQESMLLDNRMNFSRKSYDVLEQQRPWKR
jgi:uncharacterized protein (DUF488 family)